MIWGTHPSTLFPLAYLLTAGSCVKSRWPLKMNVLTWFRSSGNPRQATEDSHKRNFQTASESGKSDASVRWNGRRRMPWQYASHWNTFEKQNLHIDHTYWSPLLERSQSILRKSNCAYVMIKGCALCPRALWGQVLIYQWENGSTKEFVPSLFSESDTKNSKVRLSSVPFLLPYPS